LRPKPCKAVEARPRLRFRLCFVLMRSV
jgi:hypothetical protein